MTRARLHAKPRILIFLDDDPLDINRGAQLHVRPRLQRNQDQDQPNLIVASAESSWTVPLREKDGISSEPEPDRPVTACLVRPNPHIVKSPPTRQQMAKDTPSTTGLKVRQAHVETINDFDPLPHPRSPPFFFSPFP
jgi:hypothetical protein